MSKKKLKKLILIIGGLITLWLVNYFNLSAVPSELENENINVTSNKINIEESYALQDIPTYEGKPYVIINNNIPDFKEEDYSTEGFEIYSDLDSLGRCRVAYVNVCKEIMPSSEDERGDISSIKPTGWKQKKYNGEYLYNRCHLIGYQLSNENANELNLITGTRYFNVEGMLPFENKIAEYIKGQKANEDKHVLYRVTPIFEGNNLLASGVQMEAFSVEDNGKGVCFNVYVYNVQPGIVIDYATGNSNKE